MLSSERVLRGLKKKKNSNGHSLACIRCVFKSSFIFVFKKEKGTCHFPAYAMRNNGVGGLVKEKVSGKTRAERQNGKTGESRELKKEALKTKIHGLSDHIWAKLKLKILSI